MSKVKAYERGRQIVRLLYENGALSTRGITQLIEPPIKQRRANAAIKTLCDKGLIVPRYFGIPKNWANFYQLSLTNDTRPHLAKILDVHPQAVMEPIIRDQELLHSQQCAVWCKWFRLMFPEAKVAREIMYKKDQYFTKPLLVDYDDYHLLPDILMRIPSKVENDTITIAIEIERTRKTHARLIEKLKKLAMQAHVDGVIYICGTDSIAEAIRRLWEGRQRENSPRVNGYGDNFFLFSNGKFSPIDNGPVMWNSELKPVSVFDWVNFLVNNTPADRMRNSHKLPLTLAGHEKRT